MIRSVPPRQPASCPPFDPPSLDDLDYLPDPLGRPGTGFYEQKPKAADIRGWEEPRDD
ncbi:hypothetical protein [Ferrovibrio xuzhouensis]|uniref:Uncharacterized protein n=1 Tax=Ferrovibrio xuzhouensis TaxID=1576914 RepID=A0ABV7VD94_9PROT